MLGFTAIEPKLTPCVGQRLGACSTRTTKNLLSTKPSTAIPFPASKHPISEEFIPVLIHDLVAVTFQRAPCRPLQMSAGAGWDCCSEVVRSSGLERSWWRARCLRNYAYCFEKAWSFFLRSSCNLYAEEVACGESLAKACLGHCIPQAHGIDALVQHICNGRVCCFGFASKDEKGCTTKKNHRSFKELPQCSGGGRAGGRYAAAGVDAPAAAAGPRGE
jgi:hypothetical protein